VHAGCEGESRQSPAKIGVGPATPHRFGVKRLESNVGVEVDPGDVPCRSDDAGDLARDMAAAASGVQTPIAALQPCAVENLERRGRMASESRSSRYLPSFPPATA
jgi:hypothetical protein